MGANRSQASFLIFQFSIFISTTFAFTSAVPYHSPCPSNFSADVYKRQVGKLDLIDNDKVCMSNLNRQIIATRKTVGQYKTEVMKDRILDINPEAKVNIHNCFFLPDNADEFPFAEYDYVVDAVDTAVSYTHL